MKHLEKIIIEDGRRIRFTNFVDAKSFEFERASFSVLPEAGIEQQLSYVSHVNREFYLLQQTARDGKPGLQAVVYVGRPKHMPNFAMATAPAFPVARDEVEEELGLKILGELMKAVPGVMSLRIQSKRFQTEKLSEFVERSQKQNYFVSEPMGPVRTLMIDLEASPEALMPKLTQKTRQKIRHATREQVIIEDIKDFNFLEVCDEAMHESRKRSGGGSTDYDFHTAFEIAKHHPDRAKILGLFLKSKPESPLAYVVGYCGGMRAEYSSAGAFAHPELRALPYNYFLLWELMNWARAAGAKYMDLGGITSGDENDPLKGIARFKRSFPAEEIEVGREVVKIIRPSHFAAYSALKNITSGFRWKNPIQEVQS